MDHPRLHHKCPSTDLPLEIFPKSQSKETNEKSPKNTQKIEKKKKMSGGRRMTAGLQTAAGVGIAGEAPAHIDLEGDPTDVQLAPPRRLVPRLLKPPRQHRPRFIPGARQHVRLAPRGHSHRDHRDDPSARRCRLPGRGSQIREETVVPVDWRP